MEIDGDSNLIIIQNMVLECLEFVSGLWFFEEKIASFELLLELIVHLNKKKVAESRKFLTRAKRNITLLVEDFEAMVECEAVLI